QSSPGFGRQQLQERRLISGKVVYSQNGFFLLSPDLMLAVPPPDKERICCPSWMCPLDLQAYPMSRLNPNDRLLDKHVHEFFANGKGFLLPDNCQLFHFCLKVSELSRFLQLPMFLCGGKCLVQFFLECLKC